MRDHDHPHRANAHRSPPESSFCASAAIQGILSGIVRAAQGTTGVLIVGEPGSGRSWMARAIASTSDVIAATSVEHLLSGVLRDSAERPGTVSIDCAERGRLAERLFGDYPSSSSADEREIARVAFGSALHAALSGTLILRHLPEMPERLQHKLATILRQGDVFVVQPGGDETLYDISLRPIATADPLSEATLHPELLRRIAQTRITVPPLRQRREDIPGLVRLLLDDLCTELGVPRKAISRQALEVLEALPWRGNIRELDDVLRAVTQLAPGRRIRLTHVLSCVTLDGEASGPGYSGTLREAREAFERDYVAAVLARHRGRMAEAAKALGLQRTNLYRKVRQLSLPRRGPRRLSPSRYTEIDGTSRPEPSRADTTS